MSTAAVYSDRMLTELDHIRLSRLVHEQIGESDLRDEFELLLEDADVVDASGIPADVVTMRARIRVADPAGGEPMDWALCYPQDADISKGMISVLSPAGASLLGRKVGEEVSWLRRDGGESRLRIVEMLYQPEACGDYGV